MNAMKDAVEAGGEPDRRASCADRLPVMRVENRSAARRDDQMIPRQEIGQDPDSRARKPGSPSWAKISAIERPARCSISTSASIQFHPSRLASSGATVDLPTPR